ncbi:MAG: hypothetical protein ACK40Z_10585, partial [Dietzia sp.]
MLVAMVVAVSAPFVGASLPAEAAAQSTPAPMASSVETSTADPISPDTTLPGSGNYPLQLTMKLDVGAGVRVRIHSGDSNCMGPFPTVDYVTQEAVTTIPMAFTVRNDSFACVFEPSLQQVRIDVTGGATEVHNSLNFVQMPSVGLPNWQVVCGSTSDCSISRVVP